MIKHSILQLEFPFFLDYTVDFPNFYPIDILPTERAIHF